MIAFSDAMQLIKNHALLPVAERVKTAQALNRHLFADIFAPIALPPFDNSAVDGFALRAADVEIGKALALERSIRAVSQNQHHLTHKSCAKIMTGAPLPLGADAVVMKEDANDYGDHVIFLAKPAASSHIRLRGEDINCGEKVAKKGQKISPQVIGCLLALGIDEIDVIKNPSVKIICTGDELVMPPKSLDFGQVYFMVGSMLKAQCQELGIYDVSVELVADDQHKISKAIKDAQGADLILISGGMSKGEHDFVRPALSSCGIEEIFCEGAWRPGKPLFFGRKDKSRVFGLPGNPVASFVCFRVFVQQVLSLLNNNYYMERKKACLLTNFTKKTDFTIFARANVINSNISILDGQGSHQIYSLSQANALCILEGNKPDFKSGDYIYYYPI
jgi:molybdopterin molybdotransferase